MTNAYDEIAYPEKPFSELHPARLAAAARFFGVPCAPPDRARVLEVGGGSGASLIPAAMGLPRSAFLGFDLAGEPVARGKALIEALGLRNIELRQADIMDVDLGGAPFDYIMAHGVYSWTPDAVRAGLMRLIQARLSRDGIAIISFNAMPGCVPRVALRNEMLYAARHATGHVERLAMCMARLREMAATPPREPTPFANLIWDQAKRAAAAEPESTAHDELSGEYNPFPLYVFEEDCRAHGLQIVTEGWAREWPHWLYGADVPPDGELDLVERAQEGDFVIGRSYRQMVLARDHVAIDRRPRPARLAKMHIASDIHRREDGAFAYWAGPLTALDPRIASTLEHLGRQWPASAPVAALFKTQAQLDALLPLVMSEAVQLHAVPTPIARPAGSRPAANALARLQAAQGRLKLTTLLMDQFDANEDFVRRFIAGLDGRRTRTQLARDVAPEFGLTVENTIAPLSAMLDVLARAGLLSA